MGVNNSSSVASNGITKEQFSAMIKDKDEATKKNAIDIFTEYSNKVTKDNTLDAEEQELAKTAFQKLGLELSTNTKKSEPTTKNMISKFFQYVTQDKEFTGSLANGQEMELPAGCTQTDNGIEFGGKLYVMRGGEGDDPLRFECDDNKKTLRQALSEANSDDAVHKYHNHGDAVNDKSTYNKESGTISHDNDETAVSQTQTFASMLMNGAKASRLKLDEQKGKNGNTTTTGETILNTINTDNDDDGITMKELMSYLNAVQQESQTVQNPTGARKFAKGVDLDAKDLSNISKVFKKYAGDDNKLQKEELQKLLDDLKTKSMSDLATGEDDKYIGEKNKPKDKIKPNSTPKPKKEPKIPNNGNRTRKVKQDATTKGYGEKQRYDYHDGVRTALVENGGKLYEDENGNLAQVGHSSLFKKRFEYIEGLPKEVRAKVIDGKIEGSDDNKKIVQVKDKDKNITYYMVNTTDDNKYQLGDQLIKKNDKFIPRSQAEDSLKAQLELENVDIPKDFTLYYDKNNKVKIKENGKKIDNISYIRRKIAAYTKNKNTRLSYDSSTEIYKRNFKRELTSSERKIMEAKANAEGYIPTDGAKDGWYKKEVKGKLRHFLWNPKTETFDMKKKINFVNDKGEALK